MELSRGLVLHEIRRMGSDGFAPSAHENRRLLLYSILHFLSWPGACEAAGVTPRPEDATISHSKELLTELVLELSEDGIAPSTRLHKSLSYMARKHFGSWENACEKIGVKPHIKYHASSHERSFNSVLFCIGVLIAVRNRDLLSHGWSENMIRSLSEGVLDGVALQFLEANPDIELHSDVVVDRPRNVRLSA